MRPAANPFRWDIVDPSLFYGRREAERYLADRLVAGDRFAVAGGRRMGKTTLLRRLEADLRDRGRSGGHVIVPVYVDAAELVGSSAEGTYRLLTQRVELAARDADLETSGGEATSGPDFAERLKSLLHAGRALGEVQFVFLFDEIERVLATDWGGGFLAHWRMLLNNMGALSRSISAVFCGAGGLYRIAQDAGSPLGNILAWHELELFDYEETARLVREPSGHQWPDGLVARIYGASGGQPCLVQYFMQRVCDRDVDQWHEAASEAERSFIREHVMIFRSWWHEFDESTRGIYGYLLGSETVSEGEVIARFPKHGKRALDILAHTGVIRWDRTARTIRAAGELFGEWATESALANRDYRAPVEEAFDTTGPRGQTSRPVATVLFTDIVGSTGLTAELGDRHWSDILDRHNARVRAALAAFRGREVKTTGDGFLALFDAPAAAIRCACEVVDSVRSLGVEVRAGLHAGEYDAVGTDVAGIAISYGSWVMSKARAGEVLVSDTVKGLVAGSDIRFSDRGTHRVKGSRERRRLFAVDHATRPSRQTPA